MSIQKAINKQYINKQIRRVVKQLLNMENQELSDIEEHNDLNIQKKNQYFKQHIVAVNLGDSLLIRVKYSSEGEQRHTFNLKGMLVWENGHFLKVSTHLIQLIVDMLNYYNKSNPFSYFDQTGAILFRFKLRPHFSRLHSVSEIIDKYLSRKINQIKYNIKYALMKYGVINFSRLSRNKEMPQQLFSFKNQSKSRSLNLKMKQKIISILNGEGKKQQLSSLDRKTREQNKKSVTCEFYDKIESKFWSPNHGNMMHDPIFSVQTNRFNVTKSQFELTRGEKTQTKSLIIKEIKRDILESAEQNYLSKAKMQIQREIKIVKTIQFDSSYFIKYYFQNQCKQDMHLLMEQVPVNLSFFIENDLFKLQSNLKRFIEILNGVSILHKSGIVHRDLKPSNILISDPAKIKDFKQLSYGKSEIPTKIIDFSDSTLIAQPKESQWNKNLGSSLPYSPFECSFECDFGINNHQIDLWSLGVILYELIYRDIPCIYYRSTKIPELAQSIQKNEFSVRLNNLWHRKAYPNSIDELMNMMIKKCLQLRQIDRMEIAMIKKSTQSLLQMISQIQKHNQYRRY